jgi:hypothetical protein
MVKLFGYGWRGLRNLFGRTRSLYRVGVVCLGGDQKNAYAYANTSNFLRSLYLLTAFSEYVMEDAKRFVPQVLESLKQLEAFIQ